MKKYKVSIKSSSSYLPLKVVTNFDIAKKIDTSNDWIYNKLGIKERRVAENESVSEMGYKVAVSAISNANIDKEDIDMIIVATSSPEKISPSIACTIHEKLKLKKNIPAFDIKAVCSGFVYGLTVAASMIDSGTCNRILLIATESYSKNTNWDDRHSVFFGDGAGAAILTHSDTDSGFLSFRLYTDGSGKWNFTVPAGGSEMPASKETLKDGLHFFQMNGKAVYETGTRVLPIAINQVLIDAGLKIDQIDLMIPHQPSIRLLKKTAETIGLPWEKVMTNMGKYANTSGGTIPILLDEVNKSGKIKKGTNILFAAVGSGWTYGAAIIKWE